MTSKTLRTLAKDKGLLAVIALLLTFSFLLSVVTNPADPLLQEAGGQNPRTIEYLQQASDRMDDLTKKVDAILEKMEVIKTDVRAESKSETDEKKEVTKANKDPPKPHKRKILCWIMTDPAKLGDTAVARDLWVHKCDRGLYMSSVTNKTFPTIGVDVPAGRNHIGMKSKKSWEYLYKHHLNEFDFFLKADPDTFMVVENLREYLDTRNPELEEFYGHGYRPPNWTFTYMAGGPGMILSRAALKALVTKAFRVKTHAKCITDGQGEDWKISKCLTLAGAKPVDTRDSQGRERFIVLSLTFLFADKVPKWYATRNIHGGPKGRNCCSDHPIGFHYVGGLKMYQLYYSIYKIKLKGIGR